MKSKAISKSAKRGHARKGLHFLWITDPWDSLDHPKDTTLRLAQAALQLGYACSLAEHHSIRLIEEAVELEASPLTLGSKGEVIRNSAAHRGLSEFDQLHFRVDPPVDLTYLLPLQILCLGIEMLPTARRPELVNAGELLALRSEKTFATLLPWSAGNRLQPDSLVTSRWTDALAFGKPRGRCVLKPLHQAQSKGVELLDFSNDDAIQRSREQFEQTSQRSSQPVLVQEFLEAIHRGETRLWFCDGKLVATALKLPISGDFRVNLDRGSQVQPTRLSSAQKRTATAIQKILVQKRIRLAAVDLIGSLITDFNFTSPGMIVDLERVVQSDLARPIVQSLARRKTRS